MRILMMFTIIDVEKNGAVVLSIILICSAVPTTTIVAFLGHNLEFAVLNVLYWFFMVAFYKHKGRKIVLGKKYNKKVFITDLCSVSFLCSSIITHMCCVYWDSCFI